MPATAAIGIMCKAPQPGQTKTRLAASLGAIVAANLSACFLRDVAAAIEAVPERLGRRGYGVYAPAGAEETLRALFPATFGLLLQIGDDFGRVLSGAAESLLAAGHDCVLLVNGDSPTLPPALLAEAINLLRRPGDRAVLGPATDGGYYLIGLKKTHPRLFADIAWGSSSVAQRTRERASEIGLPMAELREWYDIDDAEAFGWLTMELAGRSERFRGGGPATATRAYLGSLGGPVR